MAMIVEVILLLLKLVLPPVMKQIKKNEKLKESFYKFLEETQVQNEAAEIQNEVSAKIRELRERNRS